MCSKQSSLVPPLPHHRSLWTNGLVALACLVALVMPAGAQTLLLKDQKIDVGTVLKGAIIKKDFIVRNSGTADLHIASVKPMCGCSTAEFDKVIRPGAEGKITITVDTKSFQGTITKIATVASDDPVNSSTTITIVANVQDTVAAPQQAVAQTQPQPSAHTTPAEASNATGTTSSATGSSAENNAATNVPPGPSIDEIAIWIKRQLPILGTYHMVTKGPKSTYGTQYAIEYATLNGGHLIICLSAQWDNSDLKNFFTSDVTMKDVDTSKLVPYEAPVSEGYIESKAIFLVPIVALPDRGTPFTLESKGKGNPTRKVEVSKTSIALDDMDKAIELAGKLRRACILCGAPDLAVAVPAAGTGDQSKPPSHTSASTDQPIMTNKDVIELVAAGLSEQVIRNSIRQASAKDFDLTPTGLIALKKAKVTDAVIVAMQEKSIPPQAAPESEPRKPAKYDPSLVAEAVKPAAAAPDPCAGIENMGVFKNQAMATAIGGGIVEWLLKIRNNTGVTKIVIYSYRDSYGRTPQYQAQIRGGEIATIRLDLTQSRFIAPVADVRIVSCQ